MNSSAKTTFVSFLAVAALGAAALIGCEVTSGTVDDTDGGTQDNEKKDSGTTDKSDSGTADTGPGTATCESDWNGTLLNATCQQCVNASCCTELQACASIPASEEDGTVGCEKYAECIADLDAECSTKETKEELDECYAPCDLTAAEGVPAAYNTLVECAGTTCAADCGGE